MTEIEQDITVKKFYKIHHAFKDDYNWATRNCKTMYECWVKLPAICLVWTATRPNVLSDKELRLFSVFCCREVWQLLIDKRSRNAVEVAERFAYGQVTKKKMQVASSEAYAAAYNAAYNATYAVNAAARAAYAATYVTARTSDAAWSAAHAAADAVGNSAKVVAYKKQADWLRTNTTPNFKRTAKNDRA